MAETVGEVLKRLLQNARELQRRGVPEPDTADEDESGDVPATVDTAQPEKNG